MGGTLLLPQDYVVISELKGNHVTEHYLSEDVGFVPDPGLDSVVLGNQVYSPSTDLAARFNQLWL